MLKGPINILLVQGNEQIHELASNLEDYQLQIENVDTVDSALRSLKQQNHHLCIILQESSKDGLELLQRFSEEKLSVPLLLLLGEVSEQSHDKALALGALEVIALPSFAKREFLRILRYICFISERDAKIHRLEEELEVASKAESAERLTGRIAHEFNNILTGLMGHTHLALQSDPNELVKEDLEDIQIILKKATAFTRHLQSFASRFKTKPQAVVVNEVLENQLSIYNHTPMENVAIYTHLDTKLNQVYVDGGKFEYLLGQILSNARDAMPEGGEIHLETKSVVLDEGAEHCFPKPLPPGEYVLVSVKDTGIGMEDETKSRLFEPFYTTKERGKGSGLGLANSIAVFEEGAGLIVESDLGKGSHFQLFFPVIPGTESSNGGSGGSASEVETPDALIIESEPVLKKLMVQVLEKAGYHVLHASDAAEALALMGTKVKPLLFVTDVVLPKMDIEEVLRRVKLQVPSIRILLVTGHKDRAEAIQKKLNIPSSSMNKPFLPNELVTQVQKLIG